MSFIINPYSFGALHPRLVAWLARGTALGYTLPSAGQQVKLNTLFYALESAGIITGVASSLLDILYIFAIDGSSDMATLNVITPTLYQATKVNSPTFTANQGFNGNGSTSYLNTNWTPSTNGVNYTLNSCSSGIYVNTNVLASSSDFGSFNVAVSAVLNLRVRDASDNFVSFINDLASDAGASSNSVGFYHLRRTGANAKSLFKNGSSILSVSSASTASIDRPITICARNAGSPGNFSTRQYGMFWAGASLNGLESSFYTAWNNYFTSL